MRVHSNTAEVPTRRLVKQYNGAGTVFSGPGSSGGAKAVGKVAPTTLGQAMGVSGRNGIVSFILSDGGTQSITIYEWNGAYANVNSGNGWVLGGNNATQSAQSCDAGAKVSYAVSEGVPICLVAATTAVTECLMSGTMFDGNPNTDFSDGVRH